MSDLTAAESAPSLSSACSQGVLPLQSLTAARVRRLFPYLGPGGQANAAATGPFSLLIAAAETTCLCSGCEQHSRAGDHKRRSAGLLLLFINSFFSLEVELTFFDLINYKLILRGNFLHWALSLKIHSKCQEHPPSLLLCLALEPRKDTEKDRTAALQRFFTKTFHLAAVLSTLWKWTFRHFLVI